MRSLIAILLLACVASAHGQYIGKNPKQVEAEKARERFRQGSNSSPSATTAALEDTSLVIDLKLRATSDRTTFAYADSEGSYDKTTRQSNLIDYTIRNNGTRPRTLTLDVLVLQKESPGIVSFTSKSITLAPGEPLSDEVGSNLSKKKVDLSSGIYSYTSSDGGTYRATVVRLIESNRIVRTASHPRGQTTGFGCDDRAIRCVRDYLAPQGFPSEVASKLIKQRKLWGLPEDPKLAEESQPKVGEVWISKDGKASSWIKSVTPATNPPSRTAGE